MVKLCQGISINGFRSLFLTENFLVTDNARSISKHMVLLKGFLCSLGVTFNIHE